MAKKAYPVLKHHPELLPCVSDFMFMEATLHCVDDHEAVSSALVKTLIVVRDTVLQCLMNAILKSSPISLDMEPCLAVRDGEMFVIYEVEGPAFDPSLN